MDISLIFYPWPTPTTETRHQHLPGRNFSTHLTPLLSWSPSWKWAPRSALIYNNGTWIHESHRTITRKKKPVFKWAQEHPSSVINLGSVQRNQAKVPISQLLPERGLTAYFPGYCFRVWFPISLYLGADYNPLFGHWQVLA